MNNHQSTRRSFLKTLATAASSVAAPVFLSSSSLGKTTEDDWELGPFVKRKEPVLRPTPDSVFRCPIRGKEVRWEEQTIEFRTVFERNIVLEADPVLLKQALTNVIDNAISAYEEPNGLVEVSVRAQEGQAIVVVRDCGCGMPEDEIEKIFTPFFSSRPAGTGLGLSLVAKIVDLHSGKVEVASELGQGSRFTIRIPLQAPEPGSEREQEISRTI